MKIYRYMGMEYYEKPTEAEKAWQRGWAKARKLYGEGPGTKKLCMTYAAAYRDGYLNGRRTRRSK